MAAAQHRLKGPRPAVRLRATRNSAQRPRRKVDPGPAVGRSFQLAHAARRFLQLAERLDEVYWVTSPDGGRVLYVNAAFERVWGQPRENLHKRAHAWMDAIHPEDRAAVVEALTSVLHGAPRFDCEYRIVRPDGAVRWIRDRGYPIQNQQGAFECLAGVAQDVTDKKRMEQLQDGQSRVLEMLATGKPLAGVLESLARVIEGQSTGLLCSVLVLDERGERLLHGAAPSLPEGYNRAIDGVAIGPAVGSCGSAAFHRKRVVVADVLRDRRWKGYRALARQYELRACWSQPIIAADGSVLGTFAMYYRNARRPGKVEIELIEKAAHIAGIAIERTRAEMDARRRLAEVAHVARVNSLGQLATGLAHELNQPLCAILANADAALRRGAAAESRTADLHDALTDIATAATRAGQIIQRLRRMVRKADPQRAPVQINDVVRTVIALEETDPRRSGIRIRAELAEGLPTVLGDQVQLEQVLLNLVRNGLDAIAAAEAGPRELTISTTLDAGGGVSVAVCDSGIGMSKRDLERVFDKFFTTKADGLGLGLSISRTIVEAHGAKLRAMLNADRGMTMFFVLPSGEKRDP